MEVILKNGKLQYTDGTPFDFTQGRNPDGSFNVRILEGDAGSSSTIYGLSTDTKPTTGLTKGRTFFEIDTTDVYMWDGSQWRLI